MDLIKHPRIGPWLLALGVLLGRWILAVVHATCRYEIVEGADRLEALRATGDPVVLSFWHDGSVLAVPFLMGELHRRGMDVTVLASQSRDGELVARIVERWGMAVVRGSATRGGRQALRGTYRAITKNRSSPTMIPDGPHGPLHEFKVGVAVLAQMAEAPILPLGFATRRVWRLRSWDRLQIPKLFSRITVVVGEPERVEREVAGEALEARRIELERALDDVTARAVEAVSSEDRR